MSRRTVLIVLCLVLGGTYFYLDGAGQSALSPKPSEARALDTESEPDYYGDNLISLQYNKKGVLEQSLKAVRSVHSPHSKITEFSQPLLVSRDEKGQEWQVNALFGTMHDDTRAIQLNQDVKVEPLNADAASQVLIETPALNIDMPSKIAKTDQKVRITRPDSTTTATGMTLSLTEQTLELHQQVTTRYAPPAR